MAIASPARAAALAHTFIQEPNSFKVIKTKQRKDIHNLTDVQAYLHSVTLESLLSQLKEKGITQKVFAEQNHDDERGTYLHHAVWGILYE
jgi:hypothetical protein